MYSKRTPRDGTGMNALLYSRVDRTYVQLSRYVTIYLQPGPMKEIKIYTDEISKSYSIK